MKKEPVEFIFIIDKNAAIRGQEDIVVSGFNAMLREQQDMEEGGAHGITIMKECQRERMS